MYFLDLNKAYRVLKIDVFASKFKIGFWESKWNLPIQGKTSQI